MTTVVIEMTTVVIGMTTVVIGMTAVVVEMTTANSRQQQKGGGDKYDALSKSPFSALGLPRLSYPSFLSRVSSIFIVILLSPRGIENVDARWLSRYGNFPLLRQNTTHQKAGQRILFGPRLSPTKGLSMPPLKSV